MSNRENFKYSRFFRWKFFRFNSNIVNLCVNFNTVDYGIRHRYDKKSVQYNG
jgi:hypothetical protein